MATVVERVDRLEEAIEAFVTNVGIEFNKLYNSQMRTEAELRAFKDEMVGFKDEMRVFKDEMRVFKDEMRLFKDGMAEFKDEMRVFKDEMRVFKDGMAGFKDEMRVFKDEMRVFKDGMAGFKDEMLSFKDEMLSFKDEMRAQTREMNRQWGEMANKLGTIVEDLVAPSLPRIVEERLGGPVMDLMVRRKRRLADGRVKEFDAVALTDDLICLNSTKATLRSLDVDRFVEEIAVFREFFPEYAGLPLVGILASLSVEDGVLSYAERQGFLVLAVGDQLMEVKNRPGFEPKRW